MSANVGKSVVRHTVMLRVIYTPYFQVSKTEEKSVYPCGAAADAGARQASIRLERRSSTALKLFESRVDNRLYLKRVL